MRSIHTLTLSLCLLATLGLAACSEPPESPDVKEELTTLLQQEPELLLDVLRQHNETVYRIAEAGLESVRQRAIMEQQKAMLENPLQPAIDPERPIRGEENAPITIVEYSDFQCPFCRDGARTAELVLGKHAGEVRLVFKHMPLSSHRHAVTAARYFEAAALQDEEKAWLLHDVMFAEQEALEQGGAEWLKGQALELGLDVARLERDAVSETVNERIKADLTEAEAFGIRGTPHFVVGGVMLPGAQPLEEFTRVINMVREHRAANPAPAAPADQTSNATGLPNATDAAAVDSCLDCLNEE